MCRTSIARLSRLLPISRRDDMGPQPYTLETPGLSRTPLPAFRRGSPDEPWPTTRVRRQFTITSERMLSLWASQMSGRSRRSGCASSWAASPLATHGYGSLRGRFRGLPTLSAG